MGPVDALERIAYLMERDREQTYRVRAFRRAAATVAELDPAELAELSRRGRLSDLPGVGDKTAAVVAQALAGEVPEYLAALEARPGVELGPAEARHLRAKLRGDCHSHTDWSDGGSSVEAMGRAAAALGHRYLVITDHSPRLTVAHGLSAERLHQQLEVIAGVNAELAPFRLLSGIEVDILEDGGLDQDEALLGSLDVVVGSVHSKLRMDAPAMTRRMLVALENPNLDILGHCTGRILPATSRRGGGEARGGEARGGEASGGEASGGEARGGAGSSRRSSSRESSSRRSSSREGQGRPPSSFDAHAIFAKAAELGKAIELNCRPERLDPPRSLLSEAIAAGCLLAIDTDAHAPGQLEWQPLGCARAAGCGVGADRVVNTWPSESLLAWAAGHDAAG